MKQTVSGSLAPTDVASSNRSPSGAPVSSSLDHQRKLDRSLVRGIAWIGGMRAVTQGIQWVSTIVVIRLLQPEDYGLVAMAMAYLGFAQMINEFGLGAAIIQHHDLTEHQIARLGGVSVLLGVFLFALSMLVAPAIAAFFKEPAVTGVVVVLAITFPIGGYEVLPRSLLKRDLEFSKLAWLNAVESLAHAVTTISLAIAGYTYWALVLGAVTANVIRAVVATVLRPHPIAWPTQLHTIKDELWFGGHVAVSRVALYVRRFADVLIVGRLLGRASLGVYNVAWTVANIPVDRVTSLVNEVTPSVLAAARRDVAALRRYLRILTEGVAFVAFPATVGLAVVADDFVLLVLGERWMASTGPLRILALTAALRSITPFLSQMLIATDQPKRNMQFSVAAAVTLPILFYVGSRWGMTGVAVAWLVGHPLVVIPILLRHALRAVEMPVRVYIRALLPAALASAVTAASVLLVRAALPTDWSLAARFAIEVSTGIVIYGVGVLPVYRSRLRAFLSLLRSGRSAQATGSEAGANGQ